MRSALPVLFVMLTACGSLVGSEGLRRIDTLEIPRNLAWELRWLQDGGLTGQCALLPLQTDDVDLTFLPFARLDLRRPEPQAPLEWQSFGDSTVSIAVPIAVTRGASDVVVRTATEQSPLQSAFGTTDSVYVHVDGNAAEASQALDLDLALGGQWFEMMDPRALVDGDASTALRTDASDDLSWLIVHTLEESDPLLRDVLNESTLPSCTEE